MGRPNWANFFNSSTEEKPEGSSIELKPEDFQKTFKDVDELKSKVAKIDSIESSVNEVTMYIRQQKADRVAYEQRQEEIRQAKEEAKSRENAPTFETDPEAALATQLEPIRKENWRLSAKNTVSDLIEAGRLEYYTGEVKLLMDKLIENGVKNSSGPLSQEFIENAYYVATGRHEQAIKEGKIKSRFTAASGAASGTGAPNTDDKTTKRISDEEKFFARTMGISEADYIKMRDEETSYV